jgi:2,4-dienoyl-CoA reductase-like NADH-dependent reductase (Old Yellow Enzyme family)
LGPSRLAKAGKEGNHGDGYFAEAATKVHAAVGGEGEGKVPVIGVGGWRTPAIMEKHVESTCDAFAISRPLINDSDIVNKWIEDSPTTLPTGFPVTNASRARESLSAGRMNRGA